MNFATAYLHVLNATSNFFVHGGGGIEVVAVLVDVTQLHSVANGDRTSIG